MKKTKLLAVFLCTAAIKVSYGQFETGKNMIGGGIGFATQSNNTGTSPTINQRSSAFSLSLSLSRFSSPVSVKGFGISYSYSFNSSSSAPELSIHTHAVGASLNRTRLQPLGKNFYMAFSGDLGAGHSFGRTNYTGVNNYLNIRSYHGGISGALGIWYHLNQRFILSCNLSNLANISYSYNSYTTYSGGVSVNSGNSSNFSISTALSGFSLNTLSVGVRYILK